MLLSDYDLINYFRQLFKVWFTNCTLWNGKQEIELSSPPETSFHLAQNRSESWLNLCGFAWLGLTSVFGFHKIIKGHFWPDFFATTTQINQNKIPSMQELWSNMDSLLPCSGWPPGCVLAEVKCRGDDAKWLSSTLQGGGTSPHVYQFLLGLWGPEQTSLRLWPGAIGS